MNAYTLDYALQAWNKANPNKLRGIEKNLSIALRYVIAEIDPQSPKLTPKEFYQYAKTLELKKLENALEIFDQCTDIAVKSGKLSSRTKANYRSSLTRFFNWTKKQVWWQELFEEEVEVAPFRAKVPKKIRPKRLPDYGLKRDQLPIELQKEIEEFQLFRETGGQSLRRSRREQRKMREGKRIYRPKIDKAKPSTLKREKDIILAFLGWYQSQYPENTLSIELLTDIQLLEDFVYWAVYYRGTTYSTGLSLVATGIAIAKWLNYTKCNRRNWSDIPLILDLQDLQSEYSEIYEQEKKKRLSQKWASKELTHEQARQVVQYLKLLCAPQYGKHDPTTGEFLKHGNRPLSAIVRAWQTYVIVKILVYCPVRQEEIRQWQLGETLFRQVDQENNTYYVVKIKKHKMSRLGKERRYRLPDILTPDIDLWLNQWHPLIKESIQTLEGWMNFWGRPLDKLERMKERLENAKQGIISDRVQQSLENYILQEEARLQGALSRYDAWENAKNNFYNHDFVFFMIGKGEAESFGQPHSVTSVWSIVSTAIAQATTALFGETKWTNPHALRHIAEKHIRLLNKSDVLEPFGTLIGHSKEMGDEYAAQILTEYDLAQKVVNDWWL